MEGALLVSHYGGRGQPEPKVSPLQLQQPQPRGAGLAAGRLHCGHIWGTAAWPGQSGSRGTGRTALEPTRPRLPGGAVGKVPDMYPNPRSVDTRAHKPHSPSQPLPQEPDHLGSTPHPSCVIYLKQVTQLLWASVTSAVRETQYYHLRHGWFFSHQQVLIECLLCARHCTRPWVIAMTRTAVVPALLSSLSWVKLGTRPDPH